MGSGWQVFSLGKSECSTIPMKVQLSAKPKVFSECCSPFLKSTSTLENFWHKKMRPIVDLLPKL